MLSKDHKPEDPEATQRVESLGTHTHTHSHTTLLHIIHTHTHTYTRTIELCAGMLVLTIQGMCSHSMQCAGKSLH